LDDIFDKSTVALTREHDVLSGDVDPALGQPGDIISITNYDKRVVDLPQAKQQIKDLLLEIIIGAQPATAPMNLSQEEHNLWKRGIVLYESKLRQRIDSL